MRTRLTDRFVKAAKADSRKSPIYMDDEIIGFGIQVRQTSRKSFTLDYTFEGRRRRLFIGDFPDWSTVAAREQAKEIKRQVDQGIDPLAARDERRAAPTIKHLVERYFEEHLPRLAPDTASDYRSMMMKFVMPVWGNRKVIDIRRSDVDQLLVEAAKGRARQRFYSMSAQIRQERNTYYDMLESTQKDNLEITPWLDWFLGCLDRAFDGAETILANVFKKAQFWEKHAGAAFNDRQRDMLNRLLGDFERKLTSSKWAQIEKCSQDTALRDIDDLVAQGVLKKDAAGGRSTSYLLTET